MHARCLSLRSRLPRTLCFAIEIVVEPLVFLKKLRFRPAQELPRSQGLVLITNMNPDVRSRRALGRLASNAHALRFVRMVQNTDWD